eukprot:scaffold873_cov393-Prasinococcus_capsulatus_cf.AAC.12
MPWLDARAALETTLGTHTLLAVDLATDDRPVGPSSQSYGGAASCGKLYDLKLGCSLLGAASSALSCDARPLGPCGAWTPWWHCLDTPICTTHTALKDT